MRSEAHTFIVRSQWVETGQRRGVNATFNVDGNYKEEVRRRTH